jgi:hypothetical protein
MKEDPELAGQLREMRTKELLELFETAVVDHHTTWSMVDYKRTKAVKKLAARVAQIRACITLRMGS